MTNLMKNNRFENGMRRNVWVLYNFITGGGVMFLSICLMLVFGWGWIGLFILYCVIVGMAAAMSFDSSTYYTTMRDECEYWKLGSDREFRFFKGFHKGEGKDVIYTETKYLGFWIPVYTEKRKQMPDTYNQQTGEPEENWEDYYDYITFDSEEAAIEVIRRERQMAGASKGSEVKL